MLASSRAKQEEDETSRRRSDLGRSRRPQVHQTHRMWVQADWREREAKRIASKCHPRVPPSATHCTTAASEYVPNNKHCFGWTQRNNRKKKKIKDSTSTVGYVRRCDLHESSTTNKHKRTWTWIGRAARERMEMNVVSKQRLLKCS